MDEHNVRLDDISPDIEYSKPRSLIVLVIMLAMGAIFTGAAWKVLGSNPFSSILVVLFTSMAGSCLFAAVISFAGVPTATVKSRAGEVLFQLRRNQDVAADYEVFILNLQRRLRQRNGE